MRQKSRLLIFVLLAF